MPDETKETPESLGSIFDSPATESPSSSASESTAESKSDDSTEKSDDKSSSEETGAASDKKLLPEEKSDESTDKSELPTEKEKPLVEKPDADPAKDAAVKKAAEEKSTVDPYEKRFTDTHNWATELNKQNSQLRQIAQQQQEQMAILEKKLAGTWTDEDESRLHEGQSTEDIATRAVMAGKAIASRAAANRDLGSDIVNAELTEFHQLFGKNSAIQQVLRDSDSPVHEVHAIMDRHRFNLKYGNTPKEWVDNISKETLAAKEKDLRKSIFEEIRAGKKKASEAPESLADVAGDRGERPTSKETAGDSLKSIFG